MQRVLIAWADAQATNLGVRALSEGTEALVRSVKPDAVLELQSYRQGSAPINIGVPRSLAREFVLDSRAGRSWMKRFDLVIDTRQGDSFADIYGLTRLRAQSLFAEFARRCGVPVALGPQTIGPFNSRWGRLLGRWSLRHADLVMARDSASAAVAEELGRAADALTTDVVFALPVPPPSGEFDVLVNISGLLWQSDAHGSRDQYRETIEDIVRSLRSRGREVTLLAHVLNEGSQDSDVQIVRKLAQDWGLPAVIPEGLDQVRAAVCGARLVLGSRMHACLNALSVGTPAIALAYSRKFAPLLGDLGWDAVVELSDPVAAQKTLDYVDDPSLPDQVGELRVRADALLDVARTALGRVL